MIARKYRKNKLYTDKEWLSTVMRIFLRPNHIAKMCGVSPRTIIKWLNRYEIDRNAITFLRSLEFNDFTPMEVDS